GRRRAGGQRRRRRRSGLRLLPRTRRRWWRRRSRRAQRGQEAPRTPYRALGTHGKADLGPIRAILRGLTCESAAQIPDSGPFALTLTPVTSQSHDAHWRRPGESPEPVPGRPASARLVDPEDDLTPVGYPGDFGTTTVIPYSDVAASG